jgi:hypothetical protein
MSVAGGTARAQAITLEWTLGESVVETVTASGRTYSQGFHQPLLEVQEQLKQVKSDANFQFGVAPNPVTSELRVDIRTEESTQLHLWLTDMIGRQYSLPLVPAGVTSVQIDMSAHPTGSYLLHISKANGAPLKTYKIVKAQ